MNDRPATGCALPAQLPQKATEAPIPQVPATDLLQRILAINASFPVDEAAKFSTHSEADQLLEAYDVIDAPSDALSYAAIRLLRYLKRPRAALALMRKRRPSIAGKEREIDFYELELHYQGGDRESGDRLLQQFQSSGAKLRPSWKRALERIERDLALQDAWTRLRALESDIAARRGEIDLLAHLPLLQAILPEPNRALEVLLFVRNRMRALSAAPVSPGPADLGRFDRYHCATLVFACGFGWSGSGAIAGFLSQHRSISRPFGDSELGYLQGRFGRPGFMPLLQPGTLDSTTMKLLLSRFFIESIVALGDIRHHYSLWKQCARGKPAATATLGQLVDDFHAAMLTNDALGDVEVRKLVLAGFIQRLLSVQGGSHVLLNNVLLASNLMLAPAMDRARFVVVQRDARDQYVARLVESGDAQPMSAQAFIDGQRTARAAFDDSLTALMSRPDALRLVRFEEFVASDSSRNELVQWLGLAPADIAADKTKFDPGVSLRNVGIHQGRLEPEHQRRIEAELGRYIQEGKYCLMSVSTPQGCDPRAA